MLPLLLALAFAPPYVPPPCTPLASPAGGLALVHGRIVDPTGAVIPHALARLKTTADDHSSYAKADDAGCYQIATVPGNYILQASSQGFAIPTKSIAVTTDKDNSFDLTLNVAYSGPTVVADESTNSASIRVCFVDPLELPVDPVRFTLQAIVAPKRTYSSEQNTPADGPSPWGCGNVSGIPWAEYTLTADAPGFVRVKEKLVSEHTYVNQTVNMTPLPVKP
jgi:hypothetical protein